MNENEAEYTENLIEEWNKLVGKGKRPMDLIKSELGLAIAANLAVAIKKAALSDETPEVVATWSLIFLGAFLQEQGLIEIREREVN